MCVTHGNVFCLLSPPLTPCGLAHLAEVRSHHPLFESLSLKPGTRLLGTPSAKSPSDFLVSASSEPELQGLATMAQFSTWMLRVLTFA